MQYDITLRITYTYERPAADTRMLLRMAPRMLPDQRPISGIVTVDPIPDFRRDGLDFFGNSTTEIAIDAPIIKIGFTYRGRVERNPGSGGLDLSCPLWALRREIEACHGLGPETPHHFLGPSDRIRHEPEIRTFAEEIALPDMSTLSVVEAICAALHQSFAFDPSATEVTTEPIEAFRNRRGVCQDMSHVMITALREVGIPAGYVSGFLRTSPPPGQARLEGADAMHAWVRAWCGQELGWVEIDPTNNIRAGTDHVVVAYGRDYADVSPVRGSMRSSGSQTTTHQVDVAPLEMTG
ncbi:Transglutaminase-like enzyme, putative cysteine protease [Poseidonocella pacifica]|uniref:Transglutaminase-like enzyme, putative cysteine protease n=1 Tax=Poseidonocella pacifica TaxID=871651 RepID=A0A1I0VC83_9RHOB|nr:transglutaminase family protein [Poseidonocella pacifica]SFA73186.1 Transglutaminase-like enzyme, putative cysteine protease [Poseidonocella pacifica]